MSGADSSGKGVWNHPSFWPACTVIFTVLTAEAMGIWFLSPVVAQVAKHEQRVSDLETRAQALELVNADHRLTSLEISREQRWGIITGGIAAVREDLSGLRATLDATKDAVNRLQNAADRPLLGRANR